MNEYLLIDNKKIKRIGLGGWTIGDDKSLINKEIDVMRTGYSILNMNILDTAEMYGLGKSEEVFGKFLKDQNRKDFFIINKILPSNASKNLYKERCLNSLKIMGVDYFDVYLLHWKSNVNLPQMVEEMEELVKEGYIKHWGVSNFDVKDMEELFAIPNGNHCFMNQCLYNISERGVEYDLIPWCQNHNVIFMAYSPFGSNKENRDIIVKNKYINELINKKNISYESLMLSFIMRNENVLTVFKTSNKDHLYSNMKDAFTKLDEEDMKLIEKAFPSPKNKSFLHKI